MSHRRLVPLAFAAALAWPGLASAVVTEIDMTAIEGGAIEEAVIIIDSSGQQIGSTKTDRRGMAAPVNLPAGSGHRVQFADGSQSEPFDVRGPDKNTVKLRRRGGAALLGSSAAAGKGAFSDSPVGVELEMLYQYSEFNTQFQSGLSLPGPGGPAIASDRDSDVVYGHNLGGTLRVLGPNFFAGMRPFVQLRGVSTVCKGQQKGGQFPEPDFAITKMELDQQYQIHVGAGLAVPVEVGPTVFTLKPYAGYNWDQFTARLWTDESFFPPFGVTETSKDITMQSVEVGGQVDFQPCNECGFYLFGGAGLRIPVFDSKRRVNGATDGGLDASGVIDAQTNAVVNAGFGYKFFGF